MTTMRSLIFFFPWESGNNFHFIWVLVDPCKKGLLPYPPAQERNGWIASSFSLRSDIIDRRVTFWLQSRDGQPTMWRQSFVTWASKNIEREYKYPLKYDKVSVNTLKISNNYKYPISCNKMNILFEMWYCENYT